MKAYVEELGGSFSVFEAFGNHAKGQRLNARDGFIAVGSEAHDAGQGWHFGKPPAVLFAG